MPSATMQQIDVERFEREGYLVLRNVLPTEEIPPLLEEVDGMCAALAADPPPPKEVQVYWDNKESPERTVRMIFPTVHLSSTFARLSEDPRITEIAATALRDEGVHLFEDKVNCKLPGGAGFEWHQDWSCCWRGMPDQLVNCFLALDAADEQNGALQVVPGSHAARECLPFRSQEEHFEVDPAYVDAERAITVPMGPGDMLLFDPFLLHHSEVNRSDRARRTAIFTYSSRRVGDNYLFPDMIELRRERLGGLPDLTAGG
jgi:hypothetical protein